MRLTDEQLRESLHRRAERISAPTEVFPAVETRARRMRRNRRGAAALGAMAAVAAIAVAVPTVVSSPGGHRAPLTSTTNPASRSASQSATQQTQTQQPSNPPAQTNPASNPAVGMSLDPTQPWTYRGDQKVLASGVLQGFEADWHALHPDSGALAPLFGQVYEPSGQPEVVFVAKVGDGARWGIATKSADGTRFLVDEPLVANTSALAAALPGDEVPRLLVVAAPSTAEIRYSPDGTAVKPMHELAPGVGIAPLEGDQAVDKIQVVGANGHVVFEAPAPNPSR